MKKGVLYLLFVLLLVHFVNSSVEFRIENEEYNIGDKLTFSATVIPEDTIDAFIELTLECEDYDELIYKEFISLEEGYRTEIQETRLSITDEMLGSCEIEAVIRDEDRDVVSKEYSDNFYVKKDLNVTCEPVESVPNNMAKVLCTARKFNGELIEGGTAQIDFLGQHHEKFIKAGIIEFELIIQEETPAGKHKSVVQIEDYDGNYGDRLFDVFILPVPTRLDFRIEIDSFFPGETVSFKPVLYDHSDEAMEGEILIEIYSLSNEVILSEKVLSTSTFSYEFPEFSSPGEYNIVASFEDIKKAIMVYMEKQEKISFRYHNKTVIAKNIGNSRYIGELGFLIKSAENEFYIRKNVELDYNDEFIFILEEEVPTGTYDIKLENIGIVEQPEIVKGIYIHVKESIGEKMSSGFSSVTGMAVSTAKYIISKPLATSLIIIVIVVFILLYYTRDIIIESLRRVKVDKKEGVQIEDKDEADVENLFDDYEFNK